MARGRHATTPTEIPKAGWKDIALRVKDEIAADHVGLTAAGVAFYALLAIFPAIGAIMAIAGLFAEPAWVSSQIEQLGALLPKQAAELVIGQAVEIAGSAEGGLTLAALFGVGLALWSASAGMSSMMEGLNIVYDETEKRGFVHYTLMRLVLTLGVIAGFFLTVLALVAVPVVLSVLPWGSAAETAAMILRWPLVGLIAIAGLAILYRYGPSRDNAEWKWITPGAAFAVALWLVASVAFAFYVRNFGSYQESFGSLGGVIVMLTWLWISSYIVLLGAEVDSEMEAQTMHDTTVGRFQEMGERGAVKADNLGKAKGAPAE